MPQRLRNWLTPAAWVAAVTAALLLVFPTGFPNYDTIYALVWGRELAHGASPDYGSALPPTPHPLADLLGLVATPLGDAAITVTMVVAYISLGLAVYLVYRLGTLWFDRWIGLVAAAIVLTRAPYLSNGIRAYVDLPYIALCLGALVIESHRRAAPPEAKPRTEWLVLTLLALAGLLRPEAWLFSIAYLGYLALTREGERKKSLERADTQSAGLIRPALVRARDFFLSPRGMGFTALALTAPILWALFDLVTTGSPTYSLTGTQKTVETLARKTGPVDLILYGPRALGEVLQWPGMVGALGGVAIAAAILFARRRRSQLFPAYSPEDLAIGLTAAALALGAFALLAVAGLAIIARYTMLAAAILAIFVAFALLGWRLLAAGHPWRRRWQLFAGVVAAMFVIWGPNQWSLDSRVNTDLANQGRIENDLTRLVDAGAFAKPLCGPIAVPNHRAVPRLAFGLEVKPTEIVSASEAVSGEEKEKLAEAGYFVAPASSFVIHNFILDPNDKTNFHLKKPPGFREVAENGSWKLYRRC